MIDVRVYNANSRFRRRHEETVSLVKRVLMKEGCRSARINVVFTGDAAITKLNARYLRHRRTTDVISFPLHERDAMTIEGEVYVNLDQARRQAHELGEPFARETQRLVAHGTLHLLGYEDASARKRGRMRRLEDVYIAAT